MYTVNRTKKETHNFYISLFRIKYKHTCIYILIHLPIVKISNYSVHLNHMVSALRVVDSVFKLHHRYGSFYSCSCPIAEMRKSHKAVLSGSCDTWTAAPCSIVFPNCTRRPCRRWTVGSQSTHLTNPVVISYEKCCCRMPRLSNDELFNLYYGIFYEI
jgi:hypothetical protein